MGVLPCLLLMVVAVATTTNGLQCWTCRRASSLEACIASQTLETCKSNEDSCETVEGRFGNVLSPRYSVKKGCKRSTQCYTNQNKNILPSFQATLCNNNLKFSLCRCCCEEDGCNDGGLQCLENACNGRRRILHGKIDCNKGNSPGSRCIAECTQPLYQVFPSEHNTSTCNDSGSWSNPTPCCARPCPPYALADIVSVFHASSLHMWHQMSRISFLSAETTIIGPDAIKYGGFYYSGKPNPESAVHFDEYDDNQLKMQLLFLKRVKFSNTDDGKVNTGAALRYAYDNMFSPERGARPQVRKFVLIMTDRNSDDDVMEPARLLRSIGVKIVVMGMHEGEARMNRTEFDEMTNREQGFVYMPDQDVDQVGQGLLDEFYGNFCKNPCEHVLQMDGGVENNEDEEV